MFTVNTNRVIKMNIGDDVQFPFFLNNGDRTHLNRYEFYREYNPDAECEEVYFYIIPLHCDYRDFVLKKTFSCNGTIITEKPNKDPVVTTDNDNINSNQDIVITLKSNDTLDLCVGEYAYMIRAKVRTSKINSKNIITTGDNEFTTLQVTNKYAFHLLDDDVVRAD